jgi:hypothetical protein
MTKTQIREGLRKLSLLGTVFLAVPVWLTALRDRDAAPFAFALAVCFVVWSWLQFSHHLKWRSLLVESSLGVSETQLQSWGMEKEFVDQLLTNSRLRADFHGLMEQHAERIADIVRRSAGEHYEDYFAAALRELREKRG